MKTIRTILFTLAAVLVGFGLFALISVKTEANLINRTLYWMFNSSYFVLLVVGVAFLLIAIILTISLVAFKDDKTEEDEDEEDEDEFGIDLKAEDTVQQTEKTSINRIREPQRRPMRANIPALFTVDEDNEGEKDSEDDIEKEEPVNVRPPQRTDEGEEKAARTFNRPMHMGEHRFEPIKPNAMEAEPEAEPIQPQQAEEATPMPEVKRPIVTRCIYCGEPIEKGNNFCPNCGRRR